MDIRINLKNIIRDKGYKQAAIATMAGLTPAKMSQIVNLERNLEANEMFAICNAMEITPNELAEYQPKEVLFNV